MSDHTITMKAISLWQPWATWVARGWKTIETRTHNRLKSLAGKRIAIHAANRYDHDADDMALGYMDARQRGIHDVTEYVRGVIVATARVIDARPLTDDDTPAALFDCSGDDRYGLILEGIRPIDPPIPCKGRQGIFTVKIPADAEATYA